MINMTRKEFIGGAAAFAAAGSFAAEAQESPMLVKTKKWFKEAQFGMMAHWGLYTLPGGEWNGKPGRRAYAEWLQWGERIPMKVRNGTVQEIKFDGAPRMEPYGYHVDVADHTAIGKVVCRTELGRIDNSRNNTILKSR